MSGGDEMHVFLTQHELAARWRIADRTLERWRAERYGPAWITIGGSIRYRMSDVLAFEAAHRKRP
ncbi:helix-turn-helix transcriptional regulator [Oceaniglobus roseus]|uniref:helix-turn-helix transcriptional regulator n=1 Tax=Oceaniglobus roseus TaxID=1737570 RepID=UPI000C7F6E31|nr:helix-turn-helix domain-containing protein [Kandeliimicrobium roseum]